MNDIKFCRFDSKCGPQSTCKGNLFGLIKGKCTSTKGACRFDSGCPKYYQCAGNQGGLTEGKCLLAISKSNPLSKSLGNISTSLLDPASQYRKTHTVNWMVTLIILAILGFGAYFVYYGFLKHDVAAPGACFNSSDCGVNGPGNKKVYFQCGQKIYGTNPPSGAELPTLTGINPECM